MRQRWRGLVFLLGLAAGRAGARQEAAAAPEQGDAEQCQDGRAAGPAAKPVDWPAGQCLDRKESCTSWVALGHCENEETAEFMGRWCSLSCKTCSKSPDVVFEGASAHGRVLVVDEGALRHLRFDHWAGDDQVGQAFPLPFHWPLAATVFHCLSLTFHCLYLHWAGDDQSSMDISGGGSASVYPGGGEARSRVPPNAGGDTVETEYIRFAAGMAAMLGSRRHLAGPRRGNKTHDLQ